MQASHQNSFNENLSKNLKQIMKENNVTESDLARTLNLPYNTIHRLIVGQTVDPRISTLKLIASYFNVTLDDLLNENICQSSLNNTPRTVPILTWEQISDKLTLDTLNQSNWPNWLLISLVSTNELGKNAYAIESRPSMQPRFPLGTFFVVDPDCPPIDGDLILVKMNKVNSVALRELMIDPPVIKLLSILEKSDTLVFDEKEHQIIGVVILSMHQCRKNNYEL